MVVHACIYAYLRPYTHAVIVHVMWAATCVSDGYQHVRWYLCDPAVRYSTVNQLEQDREGGELQS